MSEQSVRTSIRKSLEQVACKAYLSSNQGSLTGNAWNKLNLNTVDYDLGTNFDLINYKFIAPVTGLYHVEACFYTTDASTITTKRYVSAVYKNGVAVNYGVANSVVAAGVAASINDELFLQKDDYLELYGYPEVGGGTNTVAAQSGLSFTHLVIRLITKEGIRQ